MGETCSLEEGYRTLYKIKFGAAASSPEGGNRSKGVTGTVRVVIFGLAYVEAVLLFSRG